MTDIMGTYPITGYVMQGVSFFAVYILFSTMWKTCTGARTVSACVHRLLQCQVVLFFKEMTLLMMNKH